MPHARALLTSSLTGTLVASTLAGWALLSTPGAPGAQEMAATIVLGVLAWTAGHELARWRHEAPGIAVATVAAVLMAVSLPESLTDSPTAAPLGYANANGALVTAAVAGLVHARLHVRREARAALLVIAVGFTLAAVLIDSRAATVSCVLLLVVAPLLRVGRRRVWQAIGAGLLVAAVLTVTALGLVHDEASGAGTVEQGLGDVRVALWSEALAFAGDEPLRGIGAGRFVERSEIAQEDPDLRWVHSEPLQVAAELGWVGFGLLVLLVGWMVAATGRGAVLLGLLALQPMIDHTLHFPLVVVGVAGVLGGVHQAHGPAVTAPWATTPHQRSGPAPGRAQGRGIG